MILIGFLFIWFSDLTEDEEELDRREKSSVESKCPPSLYECRSGECINPKQMCDGENDCQYGEDENNCPYKPKTNKKRVGYTGHIGYLRFLLRR